MAKSSKIEVCDMEPGIYSVKIYAIYSWGEASSNYTQIENVNIEKIVNTSSHFRKNTTQINIA